MKSDKILEKWLNRKKAGLKLSNQQQKRIAIKPKEIKSPLSFGQQRLLFLQQLQPDNPFYNYADIYELNGKLELDYLLESFKNIVARHSILRTTYHIEEKEVVQKINSEAKFDYNFFDVSELAIEIQEQEAKDLAIRISHKPFYLDQGPLISINLIKRSDTKHLMVTTMHHIVTDKWSMKVLRAELSESYNALIEGRKSELEALPFQYEDYAYWKRTTDLNEKDLVYWKTQLANSTPLLQLPYDYDRPLKPKYKGAYSVRKFRTELVDKIRDVGKKNNVTLYVLLLTVYKIMLHRYSNQEDILVGTPFTTRDSPELEKLIGFFNETLVLRSDLSNDPIFLELLKHVRQTVMDAFTHKSVPFETLVKELKLKRYTSSNPLFQVMFIFHGIPETPSFGKDLELKHTPFDFGVSKFDLTLYIADNKDDLSATIEYDTDLFDSATIDRMHDHFQNLLEQIVENPDQAISKYSVLNKKEKELQLVTWNDTEMNLPNVNGIHNLIEEHAEKNPKNNAVTFLDASYTYKELNELANQVARTLKEQGISPGIPVGLCADRSLNMVVGILGILKSGGAYLPIDPAYPKDRIEFILEDADVSLMLIEKDQVANVKKKSFKLITFDEVFNSQSSKRENPQASVADTDPAYVIYTSGSSGKPKGVVVTHKNIIHSTVSRYSFYPNQPGSFLLLSSFAFDSSMVGIFWTLCSGGNLVLTKKKVEQDMSNLSSLFEKYQITHTLLLPSLYHLLLDHARPAQLTSLNTVIVAGEACATSLCELHFDRVPQIDLFNEYGPTETSVWCTAHKLELMDAKRSIPIGRPIANTEIYILNESLQPVPIGVVGELYVGGLGVTQGYLNRLELTAERFLNHPFDKRSERKIYSTGDLASYRSDGVIDFLGRADKQVKIRGYRIELNEIRDILNQVSKVTEGEILVKTLSTTSEGKEANGFQAKRLVAFFTANEKIQTNDLQKEIKRQLPTYMIPTAFVQLDEMPRLPNGKIDQNALLEINLSTTESDLSNYIAPSTSVEKQLVEIWEHVLGFSPIGVEDNFFEIGGDSILSIQINGKARKAGLNFSANQIFESQTISELANTIVVEKEVVIEIEQPSSGPCLMTPIQHWFFDTHQQQKQQWNQGIAFEIPNGLNPEFLTQALDLLILRHDALRLCFEWKEEEWRASIKDKAENTPIRFIDISNSLETEKKKIIEENINLVSTSFDLSKGELFQCLYFYCGKQRDQFILIAHHLIIDNVSWQILSEELSTMILQTDKTNEFDLGPTTITFREWGKRLKKLVTENKLEEDYNYWINAKEGIERTPFPLDFLDVKFPIIEDDISNIGFELEVSETDSILKEVSTSFGVKVNEILLTALLMATNSWKGIDSLCVEMEGHGREPIFSDIDFFNSVGWFTTVFPVFLSLDTEMKIGSNLKRIKDQVRGVPNKGMTYGVLRYLSEKKSEVEKVEISSPIVFNYLGIENHLESKTLGIGRRLMKNMRNAKSERHHFLEFNISVVQKKIIVDCAYSQKLHHAKTIHHLMELFENALKDIIEQCSSSEDHSYSPSDFPEINISLDDLDALLEQL